MSTIILGRGRMNAAMRRVRRQHHWGMVPHTERALYTTFDSLTVRATNHGISSAIIEETKDMYKSALEMCTCRDKEALLAACLYKALEDHDVARRPKEVGDIFKISATDVRRGYKLLKSVLAAIRRKRGELPRALAAITESTGNDIDNVEAVIDKIKAPHANTFNNYIEVFVSRAFIPKHLEEDVEKQCIHVCQKADEMDIAIEKTPPTLAAGALSLVCEHMGIAKKPAELATACGLSHVTINNCVKLLRPYLAQLVAQ
jgi:transcription initiation factor TFIIIB Brf1 subunit/transcription initiation factor TFIIB